MLFPYFEQTAAHDQYNFSVPSSNSDWRQPITGAGTAWKTNSQNLQIVKREYKPLVCPSAAGKGQAGIGGATSRSYPTIDAIRHNYFFSTGVFTDYNWSWTYYTSDIRQGAFGNNDAASFADIQDGTSNSIALGEGVGGLYKTSRHYGPWGPSGVHTSVHGRVVSWRSSIPLDIRSNTGEGQRNWHINSAYNNNPRDQTYAWVFNSLHPAGAQFALCDGSVQFLQDTMSYLTLCQMAYIHDGQVVGTVVPGTR